MRDNDRALTAALAEIENLKQELARERVGRDHERLIQAATVTTMQKTQAELTRRSAEAMIMLDRHRAAHGCPEVRHWPVVDFERLLEGTSDGVGDQRCPAERRADGDE